MQNKRSNPGTGRSRSNITKFVLAGLALALLIWVLQFVFLGYFAVQEPQSVPDVEDVVTDAPAEERGGVPDGGEQTSEPNQSVPEHEMAVPPPPDAPQ